MYDSVALSSENITSLLHMHASTLFETLHDVSSWKWNIITTCMAVLMQMVKKVQLLFFPQPYLNPNSIHHSTPTFSVHEGPANVDDVTDVVVRLYVVRIGASQLGQVVVVAGFGIGVGTVHNAVWGTSQGRGPDKGVGAVLQLLKKVRPRPSPWLRVVAHKGDDGLAGVLSVTVGLAIVIDQGELPSVVHQLGVGFTCGRGSVSR